MLHAPKPSVETFGNTSTEIMPGMQFSLLANDSDPDGDAVTAVPASGTSAEGGEFEVFADGTFVYVPPVGEKGFPDSFSYEITDGADTVTGTVEVEVLNELIWYVNVLANAAPGTGRSNRPFSARRRRASSRTAPTGRWLTVPSSEASSQA